MKKLTYLVVIFLVSFSVLAERFDQFLDWNELSPEEVALLRRNIRDQGVISEYDIIRQVKFLLINGNKEIAKTLLKRIISDEKGLVILKKRYLAITHFLDNDFQKSLEILSDPELSGEAMIYKNLYTKDYKSNPSR